MNRLSLFFLWLLSLYFNTSGRKIVIANSPQELAGKYYVARLSH